MDVTCGPDTSTREVWRVMRQLPGQPKARIWSAGASRAEAVGIIRGLVAESAGYWRTHERKIRFGIQHAVITEVTDMTEWEPDEAVS